MVNCLFSNRKRVSVFSPFILSLVLFFTVAFTLAGCSSRNDAMIGVWGLKSGAKNGTLTIRADNSFFYKTGTDSFKGAWSTKGNELLLYKDISNGGDAPFGQGWDGAFHYLLSDDKKSLSSVADPNGGIPSNPQLALVKLSSNPSP